MAQKELDNEFITVDFATSRFIIETKSKEVYDNLIPKVQEIANHLENGVIVTDKEIVKEKLTKEFLNKLSDSKDDIIIVFFGY